MPARVHKTISPRKEYTNQSWLIRNFMIPLLWVFSFLGSKYLCWQEVLWLIPINMRLHWKSQYKSITIWADAFGYFLSMGLYLFNSFVENTSLLKRETESILKSYEYVNVSSIQRVWSFTFQEHPSHPEYMSKFKWVSPIWGGCLLRESTHL